MVVTRVGKQAGDISMNAIKLLAEPLIHDDQPGGSRRVDGSGGNAEDIASVRAWHAYVAAVGRDAAIANSYTAAEAKRLLAGESPVRIWRESAA